MSARTRSIPATLGRAFTLVEMLAVISIIAIATAVMAPAFSKLVESVNYSTAINTVETTLGGARSLAIQNNRHTAVAFLFDTRTETMRMEILEEYQTGQNFCSASPASEDKIVAFRPATGQAPVVLPTGMAIYGLPRTPSREACQEPRYLPGTIDCEPYCNGLIPGWYESIYQGVDTGSNFDDDLPLWIFPHNDARMFMPNNPPLERFVGVDPWRVLDGSEDAASQAEAERAVLSAQSFAILFSPEGRAVRGVLNGVNAAPYLYLENLEGPKDRSLVDDPSTEAYDCPDVFDPEENGGSGCYAFGTVTPADRAPNPEVLMKTVDQLAVVDTKALADALGTPRPWYIRPAESVGIEQPEWLVEAGYFEDDGEDALHRRASEWIDGNAEILSFSRYSGEVLRREAQ